LLRTTLVEHSEVYILSFIEKAIQGYTCNITISITSMDSKSHIEELSALLALDRRTLLLSRRTTGVHPFMAAWLYLDRNHFDHS
jgi:hypothetical protein